MLTLNNVEVIYNDVILVLKGMSIQVAEGKIVGLLGSNGAGKSSTLKAISGLLKPEDGEVTDGSIEFLNQEAPVFERQFPADMPERVSRYIVADANKIGGIANSRL